MEDKLTLRKLYNTKFPELYNKLLSNKDLSNLELEKILTIALFLVRLKDKYLNELGYRLFLLYSIRTNDYKPLYELSVNKGLTPISKFIEKELNYLEKYWNIYVEMNSIILEQFKFNTTYQTIGQSELFNKAINYKEKSMIIVAPTSYGKTELILSFIDNNEFKKICIISPTKSLLSQTKKRIINKIGYKKIITYPEMYNNEDEIISVLTQERLLRLLQNNPELKFDLLIIDEAHNILDEFSNKNMRSVILASVIAICKKRNANIICKYLTPFLKSKDSLNIDCIQDNNEWFSVFEKVKSEVFYFYDLKNKTKNIIDQYSSYDKMLVNTEKINSEDDADIVINNKDRKNIIYLNAPKKLEDFASKLNLKLKKIDNLNLIKAAKDLREYVHEKYKLADYIEKGIIYHHGSIPETIRHFIEHLYVNEADVEMLIANSTLLEGVNIPATRMFILDPYRGLKHLSPSSFKNLIGRICRFSEIFNTLNGDLKYLLPEIHIIKGNYCKENFDITKFAKERISVKADEKIIDDVKNPLLSLSVDKENKKKAENILENISHYDTITGNKSIKAKTKIGQLCFQNNINIFDILKNEHEIEKKLNITDKAENINEVFEIINNLFFTQINDDWGINNNIKRLRNIEARNFYEMLINWRIKGLTLKIMIDKMIKYWKTYVVKFKQLVYAGKWGDRTLSDSNLFHWTDISEKNEYEKVNLAIVRLNEEFDFIDNEIIKYVETLHSLNLIDDSLYLKIKYGTDDKVKISLLNCGISIQLSKLLHEKYSDLFNIDTNNNVLIFSEKLVSEMKKNNENGILISEVIMNSKDSN